MHGRAGCTSRTSAEPQRDDTLRLPCLPTRAPAAAAMTHAPVEMLTEPMPSPPVPTMSTTSYGVSTVSALDRMLAARPASSSEVSPAAQPRQHACTSTASTCLSLEHSSSDQNSIVLNGQKNSPFAARRARKAAICSDTSDSRIRSRDCCASWNVRSSPAMSLVSTCSQTAELVYTAHDPVLTQGRA